GALLHRVAARDEVDQHAEVRQDDHEDAPQRLAPSAEVVAAEDVAEHDDQQPDPDEEAEEPQHRPEDLTGPEPGDQTRHKCSPMATEGGPRLTAGGPGAVTFPAPTRSAA